MILFLYKTITALCYSNVTMRLHFAHCGRQALQRAQQVQRAGNHGIHHFHLFVLPRGAHLLAIEHYRSGDTIDHFAQKLLDDSLKP